LYKDTTLTKEKICASEGKHGTHIEETNITTKLKAVDFREEITLLLAF